MASGLGGVHSALERMSGERMSGLLVEVYDNIAVLRL